MTDFDPTGHGGICAVGRSLTEGPALDLFLSTFNRAGLRRSWYGPEGWNVDHHGTLVFRAVEADGADRQFTHLPSAVSWAPDRLDVFAVDAAGDLWHFWSVGEDQPSAVWGGESLGHPDSGALDSAPSAVAQAPDRVTVFARSGPRGTLAACVWDPAGGQHWAWHSAHRLGWAVQPTPYAFSPAATSWGPDRIDLFGATGSPRVQEGAAATVEHTWQQDFPGSPAWHPDHWEPLPHSLATSSPVVVSWTDPQRIFVVYCGPTVGATTVAMTRWTDTHWGHMTLYTQQSSGDSIVSYPALASWAKDRLDVFWFRIDGQLQHGWNTTGGHLADWQYEQFNLAVA